MKKIGPATVQPVSPKGKHQRAGNTLVNVLVISALSAILIALLWPPGGTRHSPAPARTRLFLRLGNRLVNLGKLDEAVAAYRKALELHPDLALSYLSLGNALARQKNFDEAVATFRRALALAPDPAWAYDNLVHQLVLTSPRQQHRGDVRAAYRKAVELHGNYPRYHIFYSAASAAALAACGPDNAAPTLIATERAQLRQQALAWLRAEVAGLRDWLETAPDEARQEVRDVTQCRQQDPDFAGVRAAEALAKLPEAERQDWQRLWQDVEDLRNWASETDMPRSQPSDQ